MRGLGGAGVAVSVPSTRVEGNCMQFDPESTTANICDSRKHPRELRYGVTCIPTTQACTYVHACTNAHARQHACAHTCTKPAKEDGTQTRTARAHAHRCRHCSARTDRPRLALGSAHCPRTAAAHHRLPTPFRTSARCGPIECLRCAHSALPRVSPGAIRALGSPLTQSDTSVHAKHSHTHARVIVARGTPATMSRGCQVSPSCSDVTATV